MFERTKVSEMINFAIVLREIAEALKIIQIGLTQNMNPQADGFPPRITPCSPTAFTAHEIIVAPESTDI
jgi:hypothetical protein